MPKTLHRKKRKTTKTPRKLRLPLVVLFGALILASIIYLIVKVFPSSPGNNETPKLTVEKVVEKSSTSVKSEYSNESSQQHVTGIPAAETAMDSALYLALAKIGATKKNIYTKKLGNIEGLDWELIQISAKIPKVFPMAMANQIIQSAWKNSGGDIVDCIENRLGKRVTIEAGIGDVVTRKIIIRRELSEIPDKGVVALVIDDFGVASLDNVEGFLELDFPFTASVIPFEEYTQEVIDGFREEDIEIIIHMPMEPMDYPKNDPGDMAIYCNLPNAEIIRRIHKAIEEIPYAVGMNNHMGSAATSDKRVMCTVANAIEESGLFYLDSRTTIYTCAEREMRNNGIPVTHQDGNIDVQDDTTFITQRFIELALASRDSKCGMLIVGHAKENTLRSIERAFPLLDEWGIKFVRLSELVNMREKE